MKKSWSIWLFFALCFMLPLSIYAIVNWIEQHKAALPVLGGNEGGTEHRISDFSMVNQQGKQVTVKDWSDKIMVVNFFFTHCPVICPRMNRNLLQIQDAFSNDDQVRLCSFSVDPERDSVARMKEYAQELSIDSKKWDLLTGEKKEIYKLARKSFQVVVTDGDGGKDDFIHSDKLVLIDRHLRIRGYYTGSDKSDIQQLLIDINKLKHEN